MRQAAAIIVIILISICSTIADKKLDLDFDDEYQQARPSLYGVKTKDEKLQKDVLNGRGCPLCDSSVYSYCDFKIFHDACCCGLTAPQCQYTDCSFLNANTCQEHQLITKCCCYNPYRKL